MTQIKKKIAKNSGRESFSIRKIQKNIAAHTHLGCQGTINGYHGENNATRFNCVLFFSWCDSRNDSIFFAVRLFDMYVARMEKEDEEGKNIIFNVNITKAFTWTWFELSLEFSLGLLYGLLLEIELFRECSLFIIVNFLLHVGWLALAREKKQCFFGRDFSAGGWAWLIFAVCAVLFVNKILFVCLHLFLHLTCARVFFHSLPSSSSLSFSAKSPSYFPFSSKNHQ